MVLDVFYRLGRCAAALPRSKLLNTMHRCELGSDALDRKNTDRRRPAKLIGKTTHWNDWCRV